MRILATCGLLFFAAAILFTGSSRSEPYVDALTISDIMQSMVDPSANVIWGSVASYNQVNHSEQKAPRTPQEWRELGRHAKRIRYAAELLSSPSRHVAMPGERSNNPAVELHPEQIEERIMADFAAWTALVRGLRGSADQVLQAVRTRDVRQLEISGNGLNAACERCHQKYWYPNRARSQQE